MQWWNSPNVAAKCEHVDGIPDCIRPIVGFLGVLAGILRWCGTGDLHWSCLHTWCIAWLEIKILVKGMWGVACMGFAFGFLWYKVASSSASSGCSFLYVVLTSWWPFIHCACIDHRSSISRSQMAEMYWVLSFCFDWEWSFQVTIATCQLAPCCLQSIKRGINAWAPGGVPAWLVTSTSGNVKPPSLLRGELLISMGPSNGPYPLKNGLKWAVVIFHPKVPAVSFRLPSDAIYKFRLALNSLQPDFDVTSLIHYDFDVASWIHNQFVTGSLAFHCQDSRESIRGILISSPNKERTMSTWTSWGRLRSRPPEGFLIFFILLTIKSVSPASVRQPTSVNPSREVVSVDCHRQYSFLRQHIMTQHIMISRYSSMKIWQPFLRCHNIW